MSSITHLADDHVSRMVVSCNIMALRHSASNSTVGVGTEVGWQSCWIVLISVESLLRQLSAGGKQWLQQKLQIFKAGNDGLEPCTVL